MDQTYRKTGTYNICNYLLALHWGTRIISRFNFLTGVDLKRCKCITFILNVYNNPLYSKYLVAESMNTKPKNVPRSMVLACLVCTLYSHACQVRVTVGDSGLCCWTCVPYFERWLTPLRVDAATVGSSLGRNKSSNSSFHLKENIMMNNKPEMYTRERLRAKGRFSGVPVNTFALTNACLSFVCTRTY